MVKGTMPNSTKLDPGPELMSFTRSVPASVPSLVQSSVPDPGVDARKNNRLLNTTSPEGLDPPAPGLMSLTRVVPSAVPSVRHNSVPLVSGTPALKKSTPLRTAPGLEMLVDPAPGLRSATSCVPSAVPSLFHSSTPLEGSLAPKKTVPPMTPKKNGLEEFGPAAMSRTSAVPSAVPSVRHNSLPFTPSSAEKKPRLPARTNSLGDALAPAVRAGSRSASNVGPSMSAVRPLTLNTTSASTDVIAHSRESAHPRDTEDTYLVIGSCSF